MAAANLRRAADRLADAPARAIADASRQIEAVAERVGGTVAGQRLTTRTAISGSRAVIVGVPPGPWSWITDGTGAHVIRPKTAEALFGGYGHPVRRVAHRGSKGRGAWRRVVAQANSIVPDVFSDAVHKAVG